MQHPQILVLASFRRVAAFLPTLSLTPDDGDVGPQLAELNGIIDRLGAQAVAQDVAQRLARASTKQRAALRQVLRVRHMLPISAIAQSLLETPSGFGAAVKTPPSKSRTENLVAAAGGMLTAVKPYEALFVKNGLRAGFLVRLEEATQALLAAVAVGADQKGQRSKATAALKQDLRRGRAIVNALNGIVTPAIAHDDGLRAGWRSAKHVERVAVRSPQYVGVYLSTPAGTLAVLPQVPAAAPAVAVPVPAAPVNAAATVPALTAAAAVVNAAATVSAAAMPAASGSEAAGSAPAAEPGVALAGPRLTLLTAG